MNYLFTGIWSLLIVYLFYNQQTYYWPFFADWKLWLPFLAAFAVLHFVCAKIFNKKKIGPAAILALLLVFSFTLAGIKFISYDFSKLEGVNIVRDGGGLAMTSGTPNSEEEVIIAEGEIVTDTDLKIATMPPQVAEHFVKVKAWALFVLEGKVLLAIGFIIFFIALSAALGSFWGEGFLAAAALGLLPLALLAFAMAEFKIFTALNFAAAAGISALIQFPFWKKFLPKIKELKIYFDWKLSGTILFASFSLIEIVKVLPYAWDDLNVYSRYEKLIAEQGIFPHGIGSFAWSNIASAAWLFSHDIFLSTAALFATSVLGFFALTKLLKRFLSTSAAWLTSLFFYTLPFVVNQQVIDMKTDLPLFFVCVTAIDKFFDWHESGKRRDLIILAVLLGLALAIKITAFLLLATVFLAIIWKKQKTWTAPAAVLFLLLALLAYTNNFAGLENLRVKSMGIIFSTIAIILLFYSIRKKAVKNFFTPCLIIGVISAAIFSPWAAYNYFDANVANPANAIYGETKIGPPLDQSSLEYCKNPYEVVNPDYDRYTGGLYSIKDFIFLIWNTTFTPNFNNPIVDFSFIFLAAIGFYIAFAKKLLTPKFAQVAVLTVMYVTLWMFMSNGVIWYGIAGFIGGLVLLGQLLDKFPKKYMIPLFGLAFFGNFLIRAGEFAPAVFFANTLGVISREELQDYIFPGYDDLAQIINATPNMVLYRVGTFIPYFIDLPDEQINNDHYLSQWMCMQAESDDAIKSIFKKSGITHILFTTEADPQLTSADYTDSRDQFLAIMGRSGWKVLYNKYGLKLIEISN